MNNEQNINNQDNKSDLREKDFHEIVMKQYELINSQFNTIRQMQIDQEERDAEFDLSRLIPGFLRKKKDNGENLQSETQEKKQSVFSRFFDFLLLVFAKNIMLIAGFAVVGIILGAITYFKAERVYDSTIRYSSGILTYNFYEGSVKELGNVAINAPEYLATKLNLTQNDAVKIKGIKFKVFEGYTRTKKRQVNDTVIEEYTYFPFFDVILSVTDNSVLDAAEKGLTEYLGNSSYVDDRLKSLSVGFRTQLSDIEKQLSNMDSITQAAISHMNGSKDNQFFVKETGLDGKGLILNQTEPVGGIITSVINESKASTAQKALLTEQLADIDNDRFKLIESHSVSNKPSSPTLITIIIYTIIWCCFGFAAALIKITFLKLKNRVKELEKATK
jgi:hypothetical protein